MSKNAKNKVHNFVSGVLEENVPLNAANEEVNKQSSVHNLVTLRPNSAELERPPSVSPVPTHSAVANALGLGHTTLEALAPVGTTATAQSSVGMGLGFSAEEYPQNNNDDLLVAIRRSQKQQKGKRKSRRNRRRTNRSHRTRRN
jgi:hypothetical protein